MTVEYNYNNCVFFLFLFWQKLNFLPKAENCISKINLPFYIM